MRGSTHRRPAFLCLAAILAALRRIIIGDLSHLPAAVPRGLSVREIVLPCAQIITAYLHDIACFPGPEVALCLTTFAHDTCTGIGFICSALQALPDRLVRLLGAWVIVLHDDPRCC